MKTVLLGLTALALATPATAQVFVEDFGNDTVTTEPTDFDSDYVFVPNTPNGNTAAGQYTIAPSAFPWNSNFADYADNTPGAGGNYMVVNGGGTGTVVNGINVNLNSDPARYVFSFALSNACCNTGFNGGAGPGVDPSPPLLALVINGVQQSVFSLTPGTAAGVWQTFSTNFVGSGLTSFAITNLNPAANGNDFGIDDITISAVPEPATWAMMIMGFGFVGGALRRKTKLKLGYAF